jgi:hypothetical protein
MLWDDADDVCRMCDVFEACRQALADQDDGTHSSDPLDRNTGSPQRSFTTEKASSLQSSVEAAFSAGPPGDAFPGNGLAPPDGHPIPGSSPKKMVPFSTRLPEGLDVDLKVYCALNKLTVQKFIAEAICDRLNK